MFDEEDENLEEIEGEYEDGMGNDPETEDHVDRMTIDEVAMELNNLRAFGVHIGEY